MNKWTEPSGYTNRDPACRQTGKIFTVNYIACPEAFRDGQNNKISTWIHSMASGCKFMDLNESKVYKKSSYVNFIICQTWTLYSMLSKFWNKRDKYKRVYFFTQGFPLLSIQRLVTGWIFSSRLRDLKWETNTSNSKPVIYWFI